MEETIFDSLELLYLYVENIRCFESQEFVFTTEYNIKYDKDTRELNIEERHDKDYLKGFFGPNISNINLIVGKNGSGKSTILDILGNDELDRDYVLNSKNYTNKEQHYFLIFKTNKNHIYIEGYNKILNKINKTEVNDVKINFKNYYIMFYNIKENKIFNKHASPSNVKVMLGNKQLNKNSYDSNHKINYDIFYIKKHSEALEFTRYMPLINRTYYDTYNKENTISYLYDLLTSNYKYKKLLTTNISFPLIYVEIYEPIVLNKIYNILKIDSKLRDDARIELILRMLSNFLTKLNDANNSKDILNKLNEIMPSLYNSFGNKEESSNLLNIEFNELNNTLEKLKNPNDINKFIDSLKNHIDKFNKIMKLINEEIESNQTNSIFIEYLNDFIACLKDLKRNYDNIKKILDKLEISKLNIKNYKNLESFIGVVLTQFKNTESTSFIFKDEFDGFKDLVKSTFLLPENLITFSCLYNVINISIPTKIDFREEIYNFIVSIDTLYNLFGHSIFNIHYQNNISEGELKFIEHIHNLYSILINCNSSTSLIILDEPDQSFHPEWSAKYIDSLTSMLNDIAKIREEKGKGVVKYQFVISTHSPFMLTDIPKEFITKIDIVTDDKGNHNRKVTKAEQSFACNYYDLIKDSFFLEHTMGDFAYNRIKSIQKILTTKEYSKEKIFIELAKILNIDMNIKTITCQCFNEIENSLLHFIDIIGEPLIKIQLHNLWNELKRKWANNTSEFVKTLTQEEKVNLYNELKIDLNK